MSKNHKSHDFFSNNIFNLIIKKFDLSCFYQVDDNFLQVDMLKRGHGWHLQGRFFGHIILYVLVHVNYEIAKANAIMSINRETKTTF